MHHKSYSRWFTLWKLTTASFAARIGKLYLSNTVFRSAQCKPLLTFDDGPHPEITPWVLDRLKEAKISAVFYVVGENAEKHPQVIERIREEGHTIGWHTQSHKAWSGCWEEYERLELRKAEHWNTVLFRPPYGRIDRALEKHLVRASYAIHLWTLISYDFDQKMHRNTQEQFILKRCRKPGEVIVFHDSEKAKDSLQYLLPKVLEVMTSKHH